jgi:hypothetical protein
MSLQLVLLCTNGMGLVLLCNCKPKTNFHWMRNTFKLKRRRRFAKEPCSETQVKKQWVAHAVEPRLTP